MIIDWGAELRLRRMQKGLTQAQLSEKTGISKSLIGFWETGRRSPHVAIFDRALAALGYELDIREIH